MPALSVQAAWLLILALPVACVSWTVTHAELFREVREYFIRRNQNGKTLFERKFFFLFLCDYCFSHYVTILFLIITKFKLLFDDWRGYLIAGFALVWIANVYMNFFSRFYIKIKVEKKALKQIAEKKDDQKIIKKI